MLTPIIIKLTAAQNLILTVKSIDKTSSERIYNEVVTTIIAGTVDPSTLGDCSVVHKGDEIIITPKT